MFKSFIFFIVLCIIAIFPNGLFNYFRPDFRTIKIVVELGIYGLIFTNLIIRTPKKNLLRFVLVNGLIIFTTFELSNYFTYTLMQHSKYSENLEISMLFGLILILTGTLVLTLIGRIIKKTFANKGYKQAG